MRHLLTTLIILLAAAFAAPAAAQPKGKPHKAQKADTGKKGKKGKTKDGDKDEPDKDKDKGKPGEHKGKPHKDGEAKEHAGTNGAGHPHGLDKAKQKADEDRKHLKRLAKIQRLADVGSQKKDDKLIEKAKMLRDKENARHDRAVKRLESMPEKNADAPDAAAEGEEEAAE